jgi:hypoxanthine phosphoribosyltransferase
MTASARPGARPQLIDMSLNLEEIKRAREEADCLADDATVEAALDRMAAEITARLADANPLVYAVMNGA